MTSVAKFITGHEQTQLNRVCYFLLCIPLLLPVDGFNFSEPIIYEPRCEKTRSSGFSTRSDTNRAVQPQKMARGLKFRI